MKSFFSCHGIPTKVVSDIETQFFLFFFSKLVIETQYTSDAFQLFAKTYGFTHTTISPGYPQSGGLYNKTVRSVNYNMLLKCSKTKQDPYIALLQYRSTSINGVSPEQALIIRQLNTTLATAPRNLKSDPIQCQVSQSKRETIFPTAYSNCISFLSIFIVGVVSHDFLPT